MNVDLSTILSSAVISAIVAGLVNIFQNYRSSSLEYITKDRQNFRSSMRNIATKLSTITKPNSPELKELLIELKTRINPNGLAIKDHKDDRDWVKEDGYMWRLIENIESDTNEDTLSVHLDLLTKYISFQVKYDWEQTKRESRISQYSALSIVFLIMTIVAAIFLDLKFLNHYNRFCILNTVFFIVLIYGFSIVPLIRKTYQKSNDIWIVIPSILLMLLNVILTCFKLTLLSPILLVLSIFLNWINYINNKLLIEKYESGVEEIYTSSQPTKPQ